MTIGKLARQDWRLVNLGAGCLVRLFRPGGLIRCSSESRNAAEIVSGSGKDRTKDEEAVANQNGVKCGQDTKCDQCDLS